MTVYESAKHKVEDLKMQGETHITPEEWDAIMMGNLLCYLYASGEYQNMAMSPQVHWLMTKLELEKFEDAVWLYGGW